MNLTSQLFELVSGALRREAGNHPADSEEADTFYDAADALDDAAELLEDLNNA